jgi:glutathione S-transferase
MLSISGRERFMLKIWGRLSSINVQKVVVCANELGLAYERTDAGGKFGVVGTPAYQRLNPNSLVPTIEDSDFVLWESNAIVRYLSRTYGAGRLWPDDPRAVADADRWMDWQATTLTPGMGDAFMQLIRTPPEQRDMKLVEASIAKTEPRLAILDAHLADRAFVAGTALTMGDIPVACAAHRWLGLPCEKLACPNVARWLAGIRARPAFAQVLTLPIV